MCGALGYSMHLLDHPQNAVKNIFFVFLKGHNESGKVMKFFHVEIAI